MKKIVFLFILILLAMQPAYSDDAGVENIFDYGAGARAMGMGNAYVAVADDSSSIYFNPAGLGTLGYNELMLLHTTLFYNTYYNFFSFAYPTLDMGTIGLGIFRIGTGDIVFRDSHNIVSDSDLSFQQLQILIGYGIKLDLPFSLGTAIKINTLSVKNFDDANIAFDLGLLIETYGPRWENIFGKYAVKNLKIGVNFKNFLSTPIKLESTPESEQLNIKLGSSYFLYLNNDPDHKITASMDFNFFAAKSLKFNSGLEYNLFKRFFLRGGYNQNIGLVFGAGLEYWRLRLDYSLALQELGSAHRISLMWRFGRSVTEQRKFAEEEARREIAIKVKQAVEKETKELQERITYLEKEYKTTIEKRIVELTTKYEKEKEKLIKDIQEKSKEEQEKLMKELGEKYEKDRQNIFTTLSNQYQQEREKMEEELTDKFEKERKKIVGKIVADEQFKREHYTKGLELLEKEDYDGAIAEFSTVIRFDPKYIEAEEYLKRAQAAKRKPTSYSKAIMSLYYKGIDLYVAGEYEKAIVEWKKILKIDPYNKLALRNISDAEKKINELKKIKKK
ncbi:MAG: PorV/PorQ family protein [Spirochaetes bacterium]|nr:PorV/PorQ family protein [Spirochaetota bacterium]